MRAGRGRQRGLLRRACAGFPPFHIQEERKAERGPGATRQLPAAHRACSSPSCLPGWRSAPSKLHRRTSSLAAEGGNLSRQSTLGGSATAAAAAAAAEASLLEAAAETAAALASGGGAGAGPSVAFNLQRTSGGGPSHLQRTSATGQLERAGSGAMRAGAGSTLAGGRLYRPLSSISLAASDADSVSDGRSMCGLALALPPLALPTLVTPTALIGFGGQSARAPPASRFADAHHTAAATGGAAVRLQVAVRAAAASPPHRKVRFVHVKLNRAHCLSLIHI